VDGLKVQCAEQCPDWTFAATEFQGDDDLCEGDSGGPALDAIGQLIGIGSRGSADADGSCVDGVYVRVAAWREFLTSVVRDGVGDGGTDVPAWAGVDAGQSEEASDAAEIEASADDADAAEGGEDCGTSCPQSRGGFVAAGGCAIAGRGNAGAGGSVFLGFAVVIASRSARRRRKA
jgi:S1-C subfamily serine protease